MRKGRLIFWIVAGIAMGSGSACSTILGVRDIPTPADGGGTDAISSVDGQPADSPIADARAGDAGLDGAPESDAPFVLPDVLEEPPPTCAAPSYGCMPAPPPADAGWIGPLELYTGDAAAPSCGQNFGPVAFTANGGLNASAAQCTCTCAAASGVSCSNPSVTVFDNSGSGCNQVCGSRSLTPGCVTLDPTSLCDAGPPPTYPLALTPSAASGGSCTPQPGMTLPPPSWTTSAAACSSAVALSQLDCQAGMVCVPNPAAPFDAKLCIASNGDVSCPPGGYTQKVVFYRSYDDMRTCMGCSCGSAQATCTDTLKQFQSNNGSCMSPTAAVYTPGCTAGAGGVDFTNTADFLLTVTPGPGSCPATVPTASGAATPSQPTTVCCVQ